MKKVTVFDTFFYGLSQAQMVSSLTKPGDMGHVGSKYGNGMVLTMAHIWVIYGFSMGYCFHICDAYDERRNFEGCRKGVFAKCR